MKRTMCSKDVKAYVKRNKNDAADAEAISAADHAFRTNQIYRATEPVDVATSMPRAGAVHHIKGVAANQ